jgi:ubiquinone/menaquinone biosynthesis C-methylase UbiE
VVQYRGTGVIESKIQEVDMIKPRISETDGGITGELETRAYDKMMRRMRDKGWLETKSIMQAEISSGIVLEVGPGPGYLGLEWLKNTDGTILKGLDISEDMIAIAERNAAEYGLEDRGTYVQRDACVMPFEDDYFDGVFTNGSLHEWAHPEAIITEISRVLKPGGNYCISDLRRDMSSFIKWFMWFVTRPKEIRPGLLTSIKASYIVPEIEAMLSKTQLQGWCVKGNIMGLVISGQKPLYH